MYAREKVRPKLYELDQDKLAKLFADLRRESLATASFPITVRHLESMIRMSEASAKMALREYVRGDDIDLAIQVTVGSFVNAQKMSIKKTLERVSLAEAAKSRVARYLRHVEIGVPEVLDPIPRSRRIVRLCARSNGQGKGEALPVPEILATRSYHDKSRRT